MRLLRRTLRRLHRWLGIGAGAVIVAVALSGAVLVFQWPLLKLQYPQLVQAPAPAPAEAARALPRILDDWSARGVTAIDFPYAGLPVWQLYFEDGARRYLDARSGELLLTRTRDNDLLLWLRELHVHLLAGEPGEQVLGVLGFAALFLLLSGLWQWWPRNRRLLSGLVPRWQPPPRRWVSWHRSAGVLGLPVTLVLIVTGTAMIYSAQTRAGLRALFGDGPEAVAPAPIAATGGVDWPKAIAAAQAAVPMQRLSRLGAPEPGSALAVLRVRMPGEWHPIGRSRIWLDLNTARVVQAHDATQQGYGARISEAIYPLHGAFVGGIGWMLLSLLGGLALCLLFVSGTLFWLGRRRAASNAVRLLFRPPPRPAASDAVRLRLTTSY